MSNKLESSDGIICPYCGEVMRNKIDDAITYWGDNEALELNCVKCNKAFNVYENVTRVWTSEPIDKDEIDDIYSEIHLLKILVETQKAELDSSNKWYRSTLIIFAFIILVFLIKLIMDIS